MADYLVTDTELTSIANAIRTKGGTEANLSFPTGFVSAINNISAGSTKTVTITLYSPYASSSFGSFTIYEFDEDGRKGTLIGSISSPTGSTTVTLSADAVGLYCELDGDYVAPPMGIDAYYMSSGIGLYTASDGGYIIFAVATSGTIDIHRIDWSD